MLKFYDVDEKYIAYLKTFDSKVPNIVYKGNNKFVCGIVLDVNGTSYYAPISSNKNAYKTSFVVKDKQGNVTSTVRFCFMFPAPMEVLIEKRFDEIRHDDPKYADLLLAEWSYCAKHENEIIEKALAVYKKGCNKNHHFNSLCCDFKLLEKAYSDKYCEQPVGATVT